MQYDVEALTVWGEMIRDIFNQHKSKVHYTVQQKIRCPWDWSQHQVSILLRNLLRFTKYCIDNRNNVNHTHRMAIYENDIRAYIV